MLTPLYSVDLGARNRIRANNNLKICMSFSTQWWKKKCVLDPAEVRAGASSRSPRFLRGASKPLCYQPFARRVSHSDTSAAYLSINTLKRAIHTRKLAVTNVRSESRSSKNFKWKNPIHASVPPQISATEDNQMIHENDIKMRSWYVSKNTVNPAYVFRNTHTPHKILCIHACTKMCPWKQLHWSSAAMKICKWLDR